MHYLLGKCNNATLTLIGAINSATYISYQMNYQKYYQKIKIHSNCEIEDFVEAHLCKLYV